MQNVHRSILITVHNYHYSEYKKKKASQGKNDKLMPPAFPEALEDGTCLLPGDDTFAPPDVTSHLQLAGKSTRQIAYHHAILLYTNIII